MKETRPMTMKDIAKEFGISVATVSRALKDSPRISIERRRAIQQYAKDHNFYPNLIGEALRHSKDIGEALRHSKDMPSKMIGVIVPEFTHYYFSSILTGIEETAAARGYSIIAALVCGVIVSQAKDTNDYTHFQKLLDAGISMVFYDRICTGVNASRVVVDDYWGAMNAVSYMIETGCKRIAFFGATMKLEISKNRFNGYKDALAKHGIEFDEDIIAICDNREEAERMTPKMLQMDNPPDGFFAVNDDTAIGIVHSAKHAGFRIPDDVAVCGFTNGQRAIACDPMLTTVEQRGRKVGEEAANILIDQVEGIIPKDKIERRIVRTRLVVRETTKTMK